MPGQGRLDKELRRLAVPDLAHHHHVRVAAQDVSQTRGEGQPRRGVYLDLRYAPYPVLDRVLDGDDVALLVVELA